MPHDIALHQDPDGLHFGHGPLRLHFSAEGRWLGLTAGGAAGSLLQMDAPTGALDFQVGGEWQVEKFGASFVRARTTADADGATLRLTYQVGGIYELTARYTLFAGQRRLERSARLTALPGGGGKFEAFRFDLPGVSVGEPAGCVVDVPGPWFLHTYVPPAAPYPDLLGADITFHSAPDGGFGLVAVSNEAAGITLAAWMDTQGECGYHPRLHGDGARLSLAFTDERAQWLGLGGSIGSSRQQVEIAPDLRATLAAYQAQMAVSLPLATDTPAWVREMVLLEVYPAFFPGGLAEITARLPFYHEIGFDALYLMPHWRGGYMPIDLFAVDPAIGTAEDLRALTAQAHALGMRVLFDMVIHGMSDESPLVRDHPDFFFHDENGEVARHPTWKSMATDWASPDYQEYMAGLARHDQTAYGIAGYRVDAASFKGANWDPQSKHPAYQSGCASPAVMRRILDALRETNPDAALLSEVFGPVFLTVSNLAHDNQTEAPTQLLERMARGETEAADYKAHLSRVFALLPPGANRVFFARNHDTSWFHRFDGYTPRFLALDAIHALCAIPEVFAGDPENGPNPDDDPAVWDFYRTLFAARRGFPELMRGALDLDGVTCDNPHVFTALRRLQGSRVLVAVSLSEQPQLAWLTATEPLPRSAVVRDIATGQGRRLEGGLRLRPFAVAVGRV